MRGGTGGRRRRHADLLVFEVDHGLAVPLVLDDVGAAADEWGDDDGGLDLSK